MTTGQLRGLIMGITERRAREKKQREEQIINAAEKVFFELGFDNSTMDDVAAAAELSKGALYTYFKNKNELCICIVCRALALALGGFRDVFADKKLSGLKMIVEFGMSFQRFYRTHPRYYCALLSYRQHRGGCGQESKFLQETLEENNRINDLLVSILRKGMDDGSIRQDVDAVKTALTLWGDMGGLIPGFILDGKEPCNLELFEHALELISCGLRNK